MESQNVFKRLFIAVLKDLFQNGIPAQKIRSPITCMYELALKYKIDDRIRHAVMYDDTPNFHIEKHRIKQLVWLHENYRWKASCQLYSELSYYSKKVSKIALHPWWLFVKREVLYYKKVAAVLAILMGGQPSGLQRNYGRGSCKLCNIHGAETIEHILFECCILESYRTTLWNNVNIIR